MTRRRLFPYAYAPIAAATIMKRLGVEPVQTADGKAVDNVLR